MSDNQEALKMADDLDRLCDPYDGAIAAELRRLHAENKAMRAELAEQARVNGMGSEREARLMTLNAELVGALRNIVQSLSDQDDEGLIEHAEPMVKARAALAKAKAEASK